MKLFLSLSIFLLACGNIFAQKKDIKQLGHDYSKYFVIPKMFINKDSTSIAITDKYHPHLFESLSAAERDSLEKLIQSRKELYPDDSVTVTEHFFIWKPMIDRLSYEDPHYWVVPQLIITDKKFKENDIHVVPASLLIIGDTAIVDKTLNDLLHRGDRLISINDIPIEEFLGINRERYIDCGILQQYHHFAFAPKYKVVVERNNRKLTIEIEGIGYLDVRFEFTKGSWKREIYDDYKTGYFELDNFYPNNSLLIKRLAKFIKKVQEKGYQNVIIDTRRNPGGNGHNFDVLFSLFINKDTIPYVSGNKIRVSNLSMKYYDLPKDSIGKLIELPDEYNIKEIPLNRKKYLGPMNYYILISRSTQSMASSFVNILQYQGVAKLIGEPLLHNALKYGEVVQVGWDIRSNVEVYSTVMINEYTRSKDGQIYPDIEIPYVAKEYMQSDDPVLEKLLNYIKTNKF